MGTLASDAYYPEVIVISDTVQEPIQEPLPAVLSEAQLRTIMEAESFAPEWIEHGLRVAYCESHYDTTAFNPTGVSVVPPIPAYGLWQQWAGWFTYFGVPLDQWRDPVVTTRLTRSIIEYSIARGKAPYSEWGCR